ncbi:centrosomal protein of 162 kDa isoform X2 [Aricia agestis]|uniref:centrosomal protein of 162 kDa isoform X2 n=1 Tax=Aricia agestis TaxID=91739 RepID=UPI001C20AAF3|nr:centrosomal protein of 162 kDa isoform X2 [Aricia agestis]
MDQLAKCEINYSNDNSTKEFLLNEKTCEMYKDSDDEMKMIFSEIKKLSDTKNNFSDVGEDSEDVELILKKAEDIALETENLLKVGPPLPNSICTSKSANNIPDIRITSSNENDVTTKKDTKVNSKTDTLNPKTLGESRRKPKARPFSAGVVDTKKKDAARNAKSANISPKKIQTCKHESLVEELKDTNERVKGLEILNVQLTDDNKMLRKRLEQISEDKHIAELKVAECEKFVHRISKEYEHKSSELKSCKENEKTLSEELLRERNDRKSITAQREKDVSVIKDLQRQVKEMEMILRRKHPDSVSALIVAAKSSSVEDNKKKLLEERIVRLEQELKDKETHFQGILLTLQEKFGDMKQKYENHIIDVERQLMDDRKVNNDLRNKIIKANMSNAETQTVIKVQHSATQTLLKTDRASSAVSRLTQNSALIFNKLKEDSYLVATIKGLQAELTVKQRTISKINRETEELKKNLRNLQREKEVLLNINPQKKTNCKQIKAAEGVLKAHNDLEAELSETRKQKEVLMEERVGLLSSLKRTNEDLITLKKKRIQDMNLQLYPLHEEIKILNRTVEILQERLRTADDKLLKYESKVIVHAGGDGKSTR